MAKKKYSAEEKMRAVAKVINEKKSIREVSLELGIDKGVVHKWICAYDQHGMAGIDRHRISYTGHFKQAVVEDMRTNGLSQRETAAKYNIPAHDTIGKWERIYLEEGVKGLHIERRGRSNAALGTRKGSLSQLSKEIEEDLIAENQRLRAENDYLKKLNALVSERVQREKKRKL